MKHKRQEFISIIQIDDTQTYMESEYSYGKQ